MKPSELGFIFLIKYGIFRSANKFKILLSIDIVLIVVGRDLFSFNSTIIFIE